MTWRLKLVGADPKLLALQRPSSPAPTVRREIFLAGRWIEAPIYTRSALAAGDRLAGPAVVQDVDTTILLPEATHAVCTADGTLVIDCGPEARP